MKFNNFSEDSGRTAYEQEVEDGEEMYEKIFINMFNTVAVKIMFNLIVKKNNLKKNIKKSNKNNSFKVLHVEEDD